MAPVEKKGPFLFLFYSFSLDYVMSIHISPAIIMRIKEFGESDLLVSFFTRDKGRLKGIAKGARRSRRRFANCLDLFCLADMEYEPKRVGDLCFLHSCKLINPFHGIRSDFTSLSLASYMIELTETLFPLGVIDKNMFELLKDSFYAMNEVESFDVFRIFFEARAMALGGYGIDFDKCCNCKRPYRGEGRAVFKQSRGGIACLKCEKESRHSIGLSPGAVEGLKALQSIPWSKVNALTLTHEAIEEIKPVLKTHIEYHIGQRLKTANFLESD